MENEDVPIPTVNESNENTNEELKENNKEIKSEQDLYDSIINTQNQIINSTNILSGKCEQIDELTKTELGNFNLASKKYGMYLKLIQTEFFMIEDLIKKLNKELINKK